MSKPADDVGTGVDPSAPSSIASQSMPSSGGGPSGQVPSSLPSLAPGNTSTASTAPVALPFRTVTTPNPQYATGMVGILIAGDKGPQAAGFARYAKDQLMKNGKWRNMQVCVFIDQTTADAFKQYQNPRKGAPLAAADFARLASTGVWNSTPVFFISTGKSEKIYQPNSSPNSWWPRA
ncbi:hypothetical protein EON80_06590 [bacterium]|nr:MAG: hypothetical protein EON80_06590 [bacterium]